MVEKYVLGLLPISLERTLFSTAVLQSYLDGHGSRTRTRFTSTNTKGNCQMAKSKVQMEQSLGERKNEL
jgi:hypothetical protein